MTKYTNTVLKYTVPSIRPDTTKLEEKIRRTFSDINHSKIFLDPSPKVNKSKKHKWDLIRDFAQQKNHKQNKTDYLQN